MSEYVTDHDYFQECVVLQVADGLCVAKPVEGLIQVKATSNNHSVINPQIKDKDSVSALNFDEYPGNGIFVGDMVNIKQPFQVDYSFRIDGIEVNKSSFTDNDGVLEESFYGLSSDKPVTLAQNIPWVAARLVLPRVSLQSSRTEALKFPENTDVGSFLKEFEVRVTGFDNNQALQSIGLKYLHEFSLRFEKVTGAPFYQGKSFNVTLPINIRNDMGHFNFEFSGDNTQATVRYYGSASLDAHVLKKGVTTGRIISRLQRDFGIGEVINSTAKWTKSELNKVYTAFSMLPERDREVLQGLILEKVAKISNDIEDIHTLAHFSSTLDTRTNDVLTRKIVVSNKAFEDDVATSDKAATFSVNRNNQVIPVSIQTILHEVGHGVEKHTFLQRSLEHGKAITLKNAYLKEHNQRVQQYNQVLAKQKSALDAWQQLTEVSIKKLLSRAEAMDSKKAHAAYSTVFEQIKKVNSMVLQLVNSHSSDEAMIAEVKKALEATQLKSVIAAGRQIIDFKRRAWQGRLAADYNEQNGQLWQDFQQAGTAVIDNAEQHYLNRQAQHNTIVALHNRFIEFNNELTALFNNKDFDNVPRQPAELSELRLQKSIDALFMISQKAKLKQKELKESEAGLNAKSQKVNKLASELEGVSSDKHGSHRLRNFVKFVNDEGLQPSDKSPLTDYSLRSWREKQHGEYFAEAYALYLTNHQFLLRHKPELYYYFDAKVYGIDKLISASVRNQSMTIKAL